MTLWVSALTVLQFWLHTWAQLPQPVHLNGLTTNCRFLDKPKGLQHHLQRSGHPLKKMMERMPGPSALR